MFEDLLSLSAEASVDGQRPGKLMLRIRYNTSCPLMIKDYVPPGGYMYSKRRALCFVNDK